MDTNTQIKVPELTISGNEAIGFSVQDAQGTLLAHYAEQHYAETFVYEAKLKAQDPQPWIRPATMERFAEEQDRFCVYEPRIVWPSSGGRMVRRDYLRPGDRAISSHYGERTVESVSLGGTLGQTTTILWLRPRGDLSPFSEAYPSESMIELLAEKV